MHSLFFVKKNTKSNKFIQLQVVLLAVTVLVQAKAFTPLSFSKHIRNIHRANTNINSNNSISSSSSSNRANTFLHLSQSTSASTMSSESKTTNEALSEYPSNWRRFPSDYKYESNNNDENESNNKSKPSPSPFQRNNNDNVNDTTWSKEVYKKSLQKYNEYMSSQDSFIAPYIKEALDTLLHAYRLYGPENVIGSFNGGKDAVVIMEVMRAAHAKYYHDLLSSSSSSSEGSESDNGSIDIDIDYDTSSIIKPRVIYFYHKLEFPQVYDFVRNTVQNYDLDMIAFEQDISFVQGLGILVERNTKTISSDNDSDNENNNVENHKIPMAFVLGTRSTDPNAGDQGLFAPSSTWMPPFMRVNPILNWTYGHTWHFLRLFQIPYCTLYDEGYTSLGNIDNTLPCPALLKVKVASDSANGNSIGDNTGSESDDVEDDSSCTHWPAYMLKDWDQERAGRIKKEKKKETKSKSTDDTVSTTTKVVATTTAATEKVTSNDTNEKESTVSKDNSNNEDDVSSISSATTTAQRSVGLLVIGDEILKGLTPDTNTHYAATALKSNNVPLTKVSVVSDDLEEIVREIEYMSTLVDIIITSGGVGPTHDDVTIKSISKALDSEMMLNKEMAEMLQIKMKPTKDEDKNDTGDDDDGVAKELELTAAQIKMATLPECSKLRYLSKNKDDWPVLQCQNIFILPGVPQFFEKKIDVVATYLSTELVRSVAFKVVLSIDENSIVSILNNVVMNHPNVSFGSYPFVNHPEYKTVVTLEGRRVAGGTMRNSSRFLSIEDIDYDDNGKKFEKEEIDINVKVALADLVNGMPEGSVLRVDNNNDLTYN